MHQARHLTVVGLLLAGGAWPLAAQTYHAPERATQLTGFGASLLVGDGEVFIGEPLNQHTHGIVYVYRRGGGSPGWQEALRLQAQNARMGDFFGRAMALDAGHLLIGATSVDSSTGAVFGFERTGDAWRQTARLVPRDAKPGDAFGRISAGAGGVALFAALGRDSSRGAVYVFRRGPAGPWAEEAKLTADDAEPNDWFGSALVLEGQTAVVGAMRKNGGRGAAYVFRYDPTSRSWTQEAKLELRPQGPPAAAFGSSVFVRGSMALIGAPQHDGNVGAVFVFERDAADGTWSERGMLLPFDGHRGARFGAAIAAAGEDELWIGAPGAGREGRVYVFRHDRGRVTGVTTLAGGGVRRGDQFGATLDIRGDLAVIGLGGADYGEGSAVIFERTGGAWREVATMASEAGGFDPLVGREVTCEGGSIAVFDCSEVDLLSFLPVSAIGGSRGVRMNDVWGWTDPETGTEWAIAGRIDGTAFIDISDPQNPVYAGSLPKTERANASTWRDMKVYQDHVFIVADGAGEHGMQVFDLTRLRAVRNPPVSFTPDHLYEGVHSVHNIVINEESGFAYAVGASAGGETCGGALHMIDIRDPKNPRFAGCHADPRTGRRRTGYTHDAQCVVYRGPDAEHHGKEICFHAAETALGISDVTDKANPKSLSVAEYPNVGYSHQGWLTDDHRYFYMDDELDELAGSVDRTRTLVWDVTDLNDPVLVKEFFGTTGASDHNLYVRGNYVYQSNYQAGLRILDVTNPEDPREVGYFDTVPYGSNTPGFGGSWSNYPFFESGVIVVTSGREGVFFLKQREARVIP